MYTSIIPSLIPVYIESCQQYLARCQELLAEAQSREARALAMFWVINAERQLAKWQGMADRTVAR